MAISCLKTCIYIAGMTMTLCGTVFWSVSSLASESLTQVRFVMSHRDVLLGSLPTYVAQDKGFFKKNGIEVHYISGSGGGTTLRLLSTGNADMAEGGLSASILAARTDPRIELIGDWYHSANVMVWIAPSKTSIKSVQDLKGVKLGYSHPASASQRLAQLSIDRASIPDVHLVSVGGMGDNWTAAQGNVVAAGWAMEPFLSEKIQNAGAKIVLKPGDYIKHFYLEGIDVNKNFAHEHPQAVKGIFKALAKAIDFVKHHPDQAANIAAKHFKASKKVLSAGIRRYLKDNVWDLKTDPKAFKTVIKSMVKNGELDQTLDIGKLLNQSYLPRKFRTGIK